jgi:hypothetical protein
MLAGQPMSVSLSSLTFCRIYLAFCPLRAERLTYGLTPKPNLSR